ncbi:hypothetical protein PGT2_g00008 [Escherichia phage PGT2]|uniref:Uncharacterized protein n=1 Tax=Escherichia phage PGT2 TaxID=2047782 RepID=A0A2D2W362_9CAUD|nr:hypothetical protein HOS43_gp08 [Escherichia phage PGT2]ATS92426.1 hypothetical protein PGT2_g00008 [Escherichia phage PGT2]
MNIKESVSTERAAAIQYAHDNLSPDAYWLFCDRLRETEDLSPDNIHALIVAVAQEVSNV